METPQVKSINGYYIKDMYALQNVEISKSGITLVPRNVSSGTYSDLAFTSNITGMIVGLNASDLNSYIFVVGNGTDNANSTAFAVASNGCSYTQNGLYETSDIRKKNIKGELDLDKAYELVDKCQTILYELKNDEEHKTNIGMIALEIEEIYPELIETDLDGYKSLDYSRLTVVIIKILKDLIERIKVIENKVN